MIGSLFRKKNLAKKIGPWRAHLWVFFFNIAPTASFDVSAHLLRWVQHDFIPKSSTSMPSLLRMPQNSSDQTFWCIFRGPELSKNYFCLQLFSSGNKIDVQIKFDFIVDPVFCISSRTHKTPSFNMTTLELPADSNRTAGTTCALLAPLCMVIVETLSYDGCVMRCTE
ncbi:hypothetical protein BJ912DRAFT_452745 [Pholiota molesta]|nr:hypothetical protein BJ912DRAFT_452745 [Pholiota molesta]